MKRKSACSSITPVLVTAILIGIWSAPAAAAVRERGRSSPQCRNL